MDEKQLQEDLKEIESEPAQSEVKGNKFWISLAGIFLILLIISFIVVGFPVGGIIRGQVSSNPLDHDVIKLENGREIIFVKTAAEELRQRYNQEEGQEFSVCLSGNFTDGNYYIDTIFQPQMYQRAFDHVIFSACPMNTLIMLHSHPYKSCLASATDLNTLEENKKDNPNLLMVVMCEPERFSVYG